MHRPMLYTKPGSAEGHRTPPAGEPIRVLEIISDLDTGGGQEVVRTLARYLPQAGCVPVVVTLRDGPLRGEIERLGVSVEVIAGRTRGFPHIFAVAAELRSIRRELAEIVARHRIEIVHTHLLRSLDFLVLALRLEPTVRKVFFTFHNSRLGVRADQLPAHRWLTLPKRAAHRLMYRVAARFVDGIIAVSEDVAKAVRREIRPPSGRLFTIENGVDLERFGPLVDRTEVRHRLGVSADAPVIIVVAKLMEQKGHTFLIQALPALRQRYPDLRVLFLGEGPLRASLMSDVGELHLGGCVLFAGVRDDVGELLAASDLFVLPSLWEGLPMALLEAMACGLPVVATRVSGNAEAVVDGQTGILVPPADPGSLVSAIAQLLDAPERGRPLGSAGQARVKRHYGGRLLAERHAALFRSELRA